MGLALSCVHTANEAKAGRRATDGSLRRAGSLGKRRSRPQALPSVVTQTTIATTSLKGDLVKPCLRCKESQPHPHPACSNHITAKPRGLAPRKRRPKRDSEVVPPAAEDASPRERHDNVKVRRG
jgi:hypothetical protein